METLYTVQEAAEKLRLKERSVWTLIKNGKLKPVYPTPKATRIRESDLERLISPKPKPEKTEAELALEAEAQAAINRPKRKYTKRQKKAA